MPSIICWKPLGSGKTPDNRPGGSFPAEGRDAPAQGGRPSALSPGIGWANMSRKGRPFLASASGGGTAAAVKWLNCCRVSGLDQLCLHVPLYLIRGNAGWGLVYFLGRPGDLRIKKAVNDNILFVADDKGGEMIVTGKGPGFGGKIGRRADPAFFGKACCTSASAPWNWAESISRPMWRRTGR